MERTSTSDPVIEFRNVAYALPSGQQLLSGLNLQVQRGETLVLLGRSGSGKTTTLKLVNRLLTPTGGEVRVNGEPTAASDVIRLRRSIGYVIQEVGLFPHFTVERNIGLVPRIEGWTADRIRQRVEELLQMVGLEAQMASRYPHQLSGGQRQRVGVARALAADPAILLMDEPFGALDALTRDQLQREFLSLQQRLDKTVVFVTHDLREALRLGSRIALMEAGRLVTVLSPGGVPAIERPVGGRLCATLSETDWTRRQIEARHEPLSLPLAKPRTGSGTHAGASLAGRDLHAARGADRHTAWAYLSAHWPVWNRPVLGTANIIQTIPSLALFGFLLPVPWLGDRADRLAILALTLYALLPVIRNTYTGIRGVDPAVVEAGRGMGLTGRQLLFQVELPLALSVILSGVRVAVVVSVGLATIAAAIGAGGLGEFIFRGLAMVNNQLILAGAIPAAVLALSADFGLGWLEKRLRPR